MIALLEGAITIVSVQAKLLLERIRQGGALQVATEELNLYLGGGGATISFLEADAIRRRWISGGGVFRALLRHR